MKMGSFTWNWEGNKTRVKENRALSEVEKREASLDFALLKFVHIRLLIRQAKLKKKFES